MFPMASVKQEDIKVGSRIKVRNVVLTVTGQDKDGFTAEQEHKGQRHPMAIPFDSFDNPHLIPMKLVP
jgi:hypothetical protein